MHIKDFPYSVVVYLIMAVVSSSAQTLAILEDEHGNPLFPRSVPLRKKIGVVLSMIAITQSLNLASLLFVEGVFFSFHPKGSLRLLVYMIAPTIINTWVVFLITFLKNRKSFRL